MQDMFSKEDVQKIATLSSLRLSQEELESFVRQFNTIMDYFQVLNTVQIPEAIRDRDEDEFLRYRQDQALPSEVSPSQFSPYVENKCFKVPKVIDAG